jgi:hypothetical protein
MSQENYEETLSAFDKEHAHEVIIIQLMRIYDIMLTQLSLIDAEKAQELLKLHEQGLSFMPNPSFAVFEGED